MRHNYLHLSGIFFLVLLLALSGTAFAESDEDMLLMVSAFSGGGFKTHLLQANMAGASQLYTLSTAVEGSSVKTGDGNVFHYRVPAQNAVKGSSAGASNLLQATTGGASGLALTTTTGSLMVLYTVTDPQAAYVYVALDPADADTLALIRQLGTGLVRVNLANNAVEKVAPGCVVAPIPTSYYTIMQSGEKPIQFDDNGNVVFNGFRLENGVVTGRAGLKRVALPARTVTALTDDSQVVLFFKSMGNGDIVYEAASSLGGTSQLYLWKASAGVISLTNGLVRYLYKDSYKGIIYKEAYATPGTVTFARSVDGGGINRVKVPNSTPFAVLGDDGNFYGLDASQPGGQGTSTSVQVSTILPYASTPSLTIPVDDVILLPWTVMPAQISKGYLYFVARVDPGDGYGNRDIINVQRLHGTSRVTILNDKRFQLYAWRQTGGNDKLYFTARDFSATEATIYSGVIDTVKLQQGLPQEQYLSLQTVASASGAAAQVKDLEVLSPQIPPVNPGYEPYIAEVSTGIYTEGIAFSKYMNIPSVESNLQFTVKDGEAVPYLPVWVLSSLYLIPDRDNLGNASTTPLDANVCYTATMAVEHVMDYWNGLLWDKNSFLPIDIGSACNAPVCSYSLDNDSLLFDASGGSRTLAVTANADTCAWGTQIPSDATWLTVTTGGTGSGTATVTAATNVDTASRVALIQVAGKSVTVQQAGDVPVCLYTVSPVPLTVPAAGGSTTLTVTPSDPRCSWEAGASLRWLSITDGASGVGTGTVTLAVDANSATEVRSGTVTVAGQTVTVTQGGDPGQFNPTGLAADAAGNVYVADSRAYRILKFDSNGVLLTAWGSRGTGDGQFSSFFGVAVDPSGNVYVSDTQAARIQKFTADGTFVTKWGSQGSGDEQFSSPWGVAADGSGNVYVADVNGHCVKKFTSDGVFVAKWGSYGSADGQFTGPAGIAVDAEGNVYVAEIVQNRIQKFTADGTFVTKWGSTGSGSGEFKSPWYLAVDAAYNVYVTEDGGNDNFRVQKFTSNGTFVTRWGGYGTTDGKFFNPWGIGVDGSGNVYVADQTNLRIQKFSSDGTFLTKW